MLILQIVIVIVISAKSTNFTTNTRYHVDSSVDEPHRLQQQVLVLVSWILQFRLFFNRSWRLQERKVKRPPWNKLWHTRHSNRSYRYKMFLIPINHNCKTRPVQVVEKCGVHLVQSLARSTQLNLQTSLPLHCCQFQSETWHWWKVSLLFIDISDNLDLYCYGSSYEYYYYYLIKVSPKCLTFPISIWGKVHILSWALHWRLCWQNKTLPMNWKYWEGKIPPKH